MPKSGCSLSNISIESGESQYMNTFQCPETKKLYSYKNIRQRNMFMRLHKKTCPHCCQGMGYEVHPLTHDERKKRLEKGQYS